MKIRNLNVNCFNYYKIEVPVHELGEVIKASKEVSKRVNPNDPSGEIRTSEELYSKNLGGLISEYVVSKLIRGVAYRAGKSIKLTDSVWGNNSSEDFQIDHVIEKNGTIYKIETRSSFSYRTSSPERVLTGAFSVIGPYTTLNKHSESVKDFYAFMFFFMKPSDLVRKINLGLNIEIYFCGGATRDMFFNINNYQISSLKMEGASYKVIKPITSGIDSTALLKAIIF